MTIITIVDAGSSFLIIIPSPNYSIAAHMITLVIKSVIHMKSFPPHLMTTEFTQEFLSKFISNHKAYIGMHTITIVHHKKQQNSINESVHRINLDAARANTLSSQLINSYWVDDLADTTFKQIFFQIIPKTSSQRLKNYPAITHPLFKFENGTFHDQIPVLIAVQYQCAIYNKYI